MRNNMILFNFLVPYITAILVLIIGIAIQNRKAEIWKKIRLHYTFIALAISCVIIFFTIGIIVHFRKEFFAYSILQAVHGVGLATLFYENWKHHISKKNLGEYI